MKKLSRNIVAMSAMLTTGAASAGWFDDFYPNIGFDYYQAWRRVKNNLGLIFPKSYPGITVYISDRFTDYIGYEIGLDYSTRKSKTWTMPIGSNVGGITTTRTVTGRTSVRFFGGHIDLIGYLPPVCFKPFELFGALGYGNFSGFRIGVGANYMVTKCLGLRAKLGYENNSTVHVNRGNFYPNFGFDRKPFRYATTLSLGAFFKF